MSGVGAALVQTLALLTLFCALAWWMLRRSAHAPLSHHRGRVLRVIDRVSLDGRSALHLVRMGDRAWLLGVTEQSVSVVAELPASEVPELPAEAPHPLRALFERATSRPEP